MISLTVAKRSSAQWPNDQVRGASYAGDVPLFEIADRHLKHWRSLTEWIEDRMLAGILVISSAPGFDPRV